MTPTQLRLVARMDRRATRGGKAPTRAEVARLCAMVRELDAALCEEDSERAYAGSTARVFSAILDRIILAGEGAADVLAEYQWEPRRTPLSTVPDLSQVAALVRLRDAVREFAGNYPLAEYADWQTVKRALKSAGGGRKGGAR